VSGQSYLPEHCRHKIFRKGSINQREVGFTYAATAADVTDCAAADGTITITGLEGTTAYLVDIGGGAVSAQSYTSDAAGTIEITGLSADAYSVVVTLEGCSGVAKSVTIGAPSAPEYTVVAVDPTAGRKVKRPTP
jgi:hypothetical protein